jgi:electron transfer flavoprotein beta subunit
MRIMRIGVCVKQVPAGNALMDVETGVLIRNSAEGMLNPYDRFAVEAALQAAAGIGAVEEIFALSMGPPAAERALREALAMGAGTALLLSDPAFSGADVTATSRTLAQALQKYGVPDLLFCGQQSTDGDTAQVPFALAAQLGMPVIGWIQKIEYFKKNGYAVLQELSSGTVRVRGGYPAVFALSRDAVQPRAPSLRGRLAAQKLPLTVWGLSDLPDTNPQHYGLAGSPTRVRKLSPLLPTIKNPPLRVQAAEAVLLIKKALAEARV